MPRIKEILHTDNKGAYALVNVLLDDGEEAVVWVGGEVEVYLHRGIVKAHVKRKLQRVAVDKDNEQV